MKRRQFIAALVGAAAWPVVGRAQTTGKRPLVAFLSISANLPKRLTCLTHVRIAA